jgi:putative restriction endonuclease
MPKTPSQSRSETTRTQDDAGYWQVVRALEVIARPASIREISDWLTAHGHPTKPELVRPNAALLTVNDANRRHYNKSRKNFRSDGGHPQDRLFRIGRKRNVLYEPYDLATHGAFDILQVDENRYDAIKVDSSAIAVAMAEAEAAVEAGMPPIESEHDARQRQLRAVAIRRGQRKFRQQLLDAYEARCAITGCCAIEVLEAAHIVPYRGDETNRVDNGLLLRADVHTLFDLGLIWIDEAYRVHVTAALRDTEYEKFEGQPLNLPSKPNLRPHRSHLAAQAGSRIKIA